jgi:hypothetical protein
MIEITQLTKTLNLCKSLYATDVEHLRNEIEIDVLNTIENVAGDDATQIIEMLENEFADIRDLAQRMTADELELLIMSILIHLDVMRENEKLEKLLRNKRTKKRYKNSAVDTLAAYFLLLAIDISKFISQLVSSTSRTLAQNISMRVEFADNNAELKTHSELKL